MACNLVPCSYPRVSCNTGFKAKVIAGKIACTDVTPPPIEPTTLSCCPTGGVWDVWGPWSACAKPCGSCATATRTRRCRSADFGCPCANANQFGTETLPCNQSPCTYPQPSCCSPYKAQLTGTDIICK